MWGRSKRGFYNMVGQDNGQSSCLIIMREVSSLLCGYRLIQLNLDAESAGPTWKRSLCFGICTGQARIILIY